MNDQEKINLVEETIEYGYIDCDEVGVTCLYYKEYGFSLSPFPEEVIIFVPANETPNFTIQINSEYLYNKLGLMFDTWEAI